MSSSPQSIRNVSDSSLFDGDNVDPLIAYADQQQQQLAADAFDVDEILDTIERRRVSNVLADYTVAPAGVGTGVPSARPAGVGVTSSSPRRSVSPSSAASASPPPATVRMANTTRNLIMRLIVNTPMSRAEEMRLRQRYNITDRDLDNYVATLPAYATPATTAAAPGGAPPSPPPSSSPSTPRSSPASRGRGRGRRRPNIRRRPGPTNRRDQDGMRRQLDLLAEDTRQQARNRRIRNITHTNTVTTVYEDNGEPPTVRRTSSRVSNP